METLNDLHRSFSRSTGIDSIAEMADFDPSKIKSIVVPSFLARNCAIANSSADLLIAATNGKGIPNSPGTKYTWDQFHGPKIHIDL